MESGGREGEFGVGFGGTIWDGRGRRRGMGRFWRWRLTDFVPAVGMYRGLYEGVVLVASFPRPP